MQCVASGAQDIYFIHPYADNNDDFYGFDADNNDDCYGFDDDKIYPILEFVEMIENNNETVEKYLKEQIYKYIKNKWEELLCN